MSTVSTHGRAFDVGDSPSMNALDCKLHSIAGAELDNLGLMLGH